MYELDNQDSYILIEDEAHDQYHFSHVRSQNSHNAYTPSAACSFTQMSCQVGLRVGVIVF